MTLIVGILNVTPDSFSDGGRFLGADAAIAHGVRLAAEGASYVDVGGESTRPGAQRVDSHVELDRVLPVIRGLTAQGIATSIDTMRAATAIAAVEAGASIVNDVSGGLADPDMPAMLARTEADVIVMHWRAPSDAMDAADQYADVVAEVRDELAARVAALGEAGVERARIILDPGLGFSKVGESNWPLLARIGEWSAGHRVLIGASRKRFLGAVIERPGTGSASPDDRDHATTAVTALAAAAGVWGVRVHDAQAAADAISVTSAWRNASERSR